MDGRLRWVYLARHGQTEWTLARRRQGQLNAALTALGQEQARRSAATLAGRDTDMVFSSPLGRAMDTAGILATSLDLDVIVVNELAEVHHGHFAGLTNEQIEAAYPGSLQQRAADKYHWRFPGGESYADADDRAKQAISRIADCQPQCPLIVSHEMIGRMFLRQLLNLTVESALAGNHPHEVIYRIDPAAKDLTALRPPDRAQSL